MDLPNGPRERARLQWFSVVSSGRLGLLPPDCGPWAVIARAFDGAVARALLHGAGGDPVRVWVPEVAGSFRTQLRGFGYAGALARGTCAESRVVGFRSNFAEIRAGAESVTTLGFHLRRPNWGGTGVPTLYKR